LCRVFLYHTSRRAGLDLALSRTPAAREQVPDGGLRFAGADTNIRSSLGETALSIAIGKGPDWARVANRLRRAGGKG